LSAQPVLNDLSHEPALAASPFGWERIGYIPASNAEALDVAPHATTCCISQKKIPGPVEQIAVFVPISTLAATRRDGPVAEIKRRLMSLISDDIYAPGYQRALELVKTIEANSAVDAHARAIREQVIEEIEAINLSEEKRYLSGNPAYELDRLVERVRARTIPPPIAKQTLPTALDVPAERERFIEFYLAQCTLSREDLTYDVGGFHDRVAQASWTGWIASKCRAGTNEPALFAVPATKLSYDDCYRFGIDINAVRIAGKTTSPAATQTQQA
jgi:hypothetical protein